MGRGFALFDVEELHMMLSKDDWIVSSVLIYEIVDCCKFLLVPAFCVIVERLMVSIPRTLARVKSGART